MQEVAMDFRFTPEQERLRQELREFILREVPQEVREDPTLGENMVDREFSRKMGQRGWIGISWPKEYGGAGLGPIERLIYNEEIILNRAPVGYHLVAERQMGPTIIMFGSEEQKAFFLPRIARGELGFAIGYSEPGTGSDLAGLQTRAVADGDDFVINGTKIWNSAHKQDYFWVAARTDPQAPKHKGISVFLVDLKTPGITINPIRNMLGDAAFCEVVLDNVRVPKSALLGEVNQGWYIVASNLDFERSGIERVGRNYLLLQDVIRFCRETSYNGEPLGKNPLVRHRLAERLIEFEVGRLMCYRIAWLQSQGQVPNKEASISKVFGTETSQRIAHTCLQVLGLYGQLRPGSRWARLKGRCERAYLFSVSLTIGGGTSEVQRNIIATRGLGLPRG